MAEGWRVGAGPFLAKTPPGIRINQDCTNIVTFIDRPIGIKDCRRHSSRTWRGGQMPCGNMPLLYILIGFTTLQSEILVTCPSGDLIIAEL